MSQPALWHHEVDQKQKILGSELPHRSLARIFCIKELPETMTSLGSDAKKVSESKVEVEQAVAYCLSLAA
jgi:hypothetical protein